MPKSPQPDAHDPFGALRSANYRLFAGGFICSSTGLQMMGAAVMWEIYDRTGDPLALGLVGLARALPVVLLALPAGHIVDSVSRKKVLVCTQVAMAGAAGLLAAVSALNAPLWSLYCLLLVTGCARSFNGPSRSSLLPQIVPPGQFHNAVTWNSGVFQFSAVAGPIFAGLLLDWLRVGWPVYALTSVLCLSFAITGTFLKPRPMKLGPRGMSLDSMTAGMRHLVAEKTILATITLDLFAVLLGGATALLPVYAKEILHVQATGYGLLRASPYVGALLMALWLAFRPPFARAGRALLWAVAIYGTTIVIFGLSSVFWISVLALAAGGAADNISVVIRHVLVQVRTPEHLRGRVSAVNSVFIECSNELGAFESGAVAKLVGSSFGQVTGAVASVVGGGIGTILVVVGVGWLWPEIRRLGSLGEPSHGESPSEKSAGTVAQSAPV